MGREHKDFEGLLLQGGNDSGEKTVRLEGLTISMTCLAKIAVGSDKEPRRYELKMTSDMIGGPILEWYPNPMEGAINIVNTTGETTPAAVPQRTLANALYDAMQRVKRKTTEVGVEEPKEIKKAKTSNPQRAAGSK
ncbi:hypothetical protein TRIUR3_34716 [Triticum urartu]|uniref:Uncharacterized protein n=2 Tax=Triticum urartu TaxID=4572 RepID=M7YTY0_TRIUA|nr:hypothetical protein TRIUR3_34716 [Triticum urartu]